MEIESTTTVSATAMDLDFTVPPSVSATSMTATMATTVSASATCHGVV
jgi:hypothetical protein